MSNLVRLSPTCLIEFAEKFTKSILQEEIYAYKFDNKNIQLLNDDGSINDRDKSYCPYYQNILLKRTPYPFFSEEFHNASRLSQYVSPSCPAIEYNKARVNFASGYFYDNNTYMSGIRLYYIIDGVKDFTVAAIIDERTSSLIKANTINYVLDGVIFNSSFDIDFLNVSQLFNSQDSDIIALRTHLFGAGAHSCSELFIEQFVVDNNQVMVFTDKDNKQFKRFFIENINKSYYTKQELTDELFVSLRNDTENHCLAMKLLHTKYDVQQYLEQKLTMDDTWEIQYELTTTAYNINGVVIGSNSIQLSNYSNQFTEIIYRPIMLNAWMNPENEVDKVDHAVFDLRCIASTGLAQLEITRYAKLLITNVDQFYIPTPNINIIAPKVYSKKEVITHEVKMITDLPNIVKIISPYYVFTTVGDDIQLTPYDTNIAIDLKKYNITQTNNLKIRFDAREYLIKSIVDNKAIFTIPGNEYLKTTKTYYLCSEDGGIITHGNVLRIN